jgi:hypothetical protein
MNRETEVLEQALSDLERELDTRFDMHERIAVQHVLERLVDEAPRRREPWH